MTLIQDRDSEWRPVRLARAETRTVRATSNGRDYRISLSIPDGQAPASGFPSLIVLDGGALFPTVAEAERRLNHRSEATGVTPTVVIGVGHDGDSLYDTAQRRRDFTPGPAVDDEESNVGDTGGADQMLDFLLHQVLPLAGERVRLDPSRRALLGHSLAGYFTLHALVNRPAAFTAYGAISPSIWWNPAHVSEAMTAMTDLSPRLFLAVGELEQALEGSPRGKRRMIEATKDLARVAQATGLAETALRIFPEENHASVVSVAATRFLRVMHTDAPA